MERDLYGFQIKLSVQAVGERIDCDKAADKEEEKWRQFVDKSKLPAEGKLKEMVRKGIPPTCRTWVWMEASGASAKKAQLPTGYYQKMVVAGESTSKHLKYIDMDLQSTFPNHPWLQTDDGKAGCRRVLAAFSTHNDVVGYCRGMNNMVALLLVAMNRNEENAFWLMAALIDDILYPGTFSQHLEGAQVEMKALGELVSNKLPRLWAHFSNLEVDMSMIAAEWYLGLFCTALPSETVVRVWDALFNEGPKILFRVALALLKMHEDVLLLKDNAGELIMTVRQAATALHNRDKLMDMAFHGIGSMPMAAIDSMREEKAREVEAIMRERSVHANREALKSAIAQGDKRTEEMLEEELPDQKGVKAVVAEARQAAASITEGFKGMFAGLKQSTAKLGEQLTKAFDKDKPEGGSPGAGPSK